MEGPVDNDRDDQDESPMMNLDDLNNYEYWNEFCANTEEILLQDVNPKGINVAHDPKSSAGSSRNVDDFADLKEAPRDLTELPHVSDPNSSLLDPARTDAEYLDIYCISDDSVKQTNEDLGWEQKTSANEEIQKPSEEMLSLALHDKNLKNRIENESGIGQSVPEPPEPQGANYNTEHSGCLGLYNSFESSTINFFTEMFESPSNPAPTQSVSVSKNTHSLGEGNSSAPLPSHEYGVKLNSTEVILSGNGSQAEENTDNSSTSSNNQDSSDNNNDANIIQESPVVVSQTPSQNISGDRVEPAGFQGGNLPTHPVADTNIPVIVDGSNFLLINSPPCACQGARSYLIPLATPPQPHPEKRNLPSDSDCLKEPGSSSPAKRQRAEEKEYVSQGTQTCSPVQFPDQFRKMETVDRVKECDEFLKESKDNFTSCVEMLSQIEGLKSMSAAIATYRVMKELLTTSCAKKFNWAGQSKKSNKIALKSYTSLCSAICKSVDPGHAHSKTVKDAIQVWLKSSPSRK